MAGTKIMVCLGLVAATVAAASAAAAVPPATPDVSQMALRAADVPGAKVKGHATMPQGGYAGGYERVFDLKTPYGVSRIVHIDSEVTLAPTTGRATTDFAAFNKGLRSAKARESVAAALVKGAGKSVKREDVTLGKLRTPPIGDQGLELPATLRLTSARVHFAFTFFRVDRVIALLVTFGVRAAAQPDVVKLASLMVAHIGEQLVPVSTAPPTTAGTAQQGQTLTATGGTWVNAPQLSYQWQRCDAAGAACTDVAGATATTYVVTPADAGATLRVTEKATNRFGTVTAQSTQTAVVT